MKLWIARDSNKELWIYDHKPIKKDGFFELAKCFASELPIWAFPEVTFENSPHEVELKIVKEI